MSGLEGEWLDNIYMQKAYNVGLNVLNVFNVLAYLLN